MTVRWGVIGCGRLPNTFTIPLGLVEARNSHLVGVADVVAARARETAQRFEVRAYADADDLLADPGIDAVYVATPTVSHSKLTIAAARRGKHVLCEKPLGLNPEEAAEMVRVCEEEGITLGHGTMMRYNACHATMRRIVAEGALGQPVAMHALYSDLWPTDLEGLSQSAEQVWALGEERAITWRQRRSLGGGGPMADLGIHVIDTMVFIMGRVREVASLCDTLTSRLDVEDTASVLLKFENGAQATIECYSSAAKFKGRRSLRIYGSEGSLLAYESLGPQTTEDCLLHFDGRADPYAEALPVQIDVTRVNMYETQFRLFSEAVESEAPYAVSGREGLHTVRVLDAVYRSSRERRFVTITEYGE